MKRMEHERISQRFIETKRELRKELSGRVLSEAEVLEVIRAVTDN